MKEVLTLEKKNKVSIRGGFEMIKIRYNDPTQRNSYATSSVDIRIPAIACVVLESDRKNLIIELVNGKAIKIQECNELYGIVTNVIYQYELSRIPRPVEFNCEASKFRCNY